MGLFDKVKNALKQEKKNSNPKSDFEVYICHDEEDRNLAEDICNALEDNGIGCCLKARDLNGNDVGEVINAINSSKVMILVFSNNSGRSDVVVGQVNVAFTRNIPILVFKADESKLEGSLEFFLKNKHWLDAYPQPEKKYGELIQNTGRLLGRFISEPVLSSAQGNSAVERDMLQSDSNFRYLDNLIHSGNNEVMLDRDIAFDDDVPDYVRLDVDGIVIDGNGHSIDAKGKTPIFFCSANRITLKNLVLKNASSPKHGGSAINNYGGTIKLFEVDIDDCVSEFNGGGIYNNNGEIELSNCRMINNSSRNGDGTAIYNANGKIRIKDSKLANNSSLDGKGSIVFIDRGMAIIINSDISDNNTEENIISNFDTLTVENVRFKNNSSKNIILNNKNSTLTVYGCEFRNNDIIGSPIHNSGEYCSVSKTDFENESSRYCICNESVLTLKKLETSNFDKALLNYGVTLMKDMPKDFEEIIENHGTIKHNLISDELKFDFLYLDNLIHSSKSNEIILNRDIHLEEYERDYYEGGIELDIDGLVIDGGGRTINGDHKSRIFIVTGNDITLKNITFENGLVSENYDAPLNNHGGALRINSKSNLKIQNCIFKNNSSQKQGGAISNNGNVFIEKSIFNSNMAYEGSGAIYNQKGMMEISNTLFEGNYVNDNQLNYYCYGGVVNNLKGATFKMDSCEITNSRLEGFRCYGGAIHNRGEMCIADSILSMNASQRNGGMLYNDEGNVDVSNCKIFNNAALNGDGGAVYNYHGKIDIENCEFHENHAKYDGGAIHNSDEASIVDCKFYKNSVEIRNGGAVYNQSEGLIERSLLKENAATDGGAIWTSDSSFIIKECGFFENRPNDIEKL